MEVHLNPLQPLLKRTLVIVAHPDDEVVGAGILLQRMREVAVVFCTDGAPRDRFFWERHGSRENYACIRQREAHKALHESGVSEVHFLASKCGRDDMFVDQDLFLGIPRAVERISELILRLQPEALLTTAYEGGHPDHDACSFITSVLARRHAIPAWEFPLYHRQDGRMVTQQFLQQLGGEVRLEPTPEELERKRALLAAYATQEPTLSMFAPEIERMREQPHYNYSRRPHPGTLNYEAWGWCMNGAQVSAVCSAYLDWERRKQHGLGPCGPGVREVA